MSSRLAFQTQLASIMEVLANAAVAEICKLVDDDYAVVSLQMSQCQRENKALKRKLHLLELKMARGNAERRLRESAMNSCRPRGHLHPGDKPRESSPCIGGMFSQHVDVALWSGRAAARDATSEPVLSERIQSKSPDVQLVESEPVLVKEEKMETNMSQELEEGVALMGDGGVLEHAPHGAASQRPSLELQDTQSTSSQSQNQIQSGRARFTTSSSSNNNSRGVERDEEPDVVLVKVEEANLAAETPNQTGLSIQEGLVESSTDDYRGVLPFDETVHATSTQMSDLQDSRRGFSEVSNGDTSLWTNRGGIYGDSLPGPSSHYAPPSYLPSSHAGAEPGGSGKGLSVENSVKRGSSAEGSRGLSSFPFEQQLPIIDLSEEASPGQASGQMHVGQMSVDAQKIPMRRVYLCSFCGKGFRSPANLESHLRTHTGERPYGCVICGKKFSQFWNLKIHKNIHTGERPYQCTLCPERFSDPSNLKKHQKRHHPQDTGMHSGTS